MIVTCLPVAAFVLTILPADSGRQPVERALATGGSEWGPASCSGALSTFLTWLPQTLWGGAERRGGGHSSSLYPRERRERALCPSASKRERAPSFRHSTTPKTGGPKMRCEDPPEPARCSSRHATARRPKAPGRSYTSFGSV